MLFVGDYYTAGGPICVSSLQQAREWSGYKGDYFDLINRPEDDWVSLFGSKSGGKFAIIETESHQFAVFQGDDSFLVLNVLYKPIDLQLEKLASVLERFAKNAKFEMELDDSLLAVFDSSLPGDAFQTGIAAGPCSHRKQSYRDAVVLQVGRGVWEVFDYSFRSKDIHMEGGMFVLKR